MDKVRKPSNSVSNEMITLLFALAHSKIGRTSFRIVGGLICTAAYSKRQCPSQSPLWEPQTQRSRIRIVSCHVTPCCLLDVYKRFEWISYCNSGKKPALHLKMKTTGSSEMLVNIYQTLWCHRALLEELTVFMLDRELPPFMKPERLLLCS
jgi:hypothetical protein